MSAALGFRDQVVTLAKQGYRPRQIFDLVPEASNLTQIYKLLRQARRTDETIPQFAAGRLPDALPPELLGAFVPYAEQRRVTATELAVALLTVIVRDGLVDAIMDDGSAS